MQPVLAWPSAALGEMFVSWYLCLCLQCLTPAGL